MTRVPPSFGVIICPNSTVGAYRSLGLGFGKNLEGGALTSHNPYSGGSPLILFSLSGFTTSKLAAHINTFWSPLPMEAPVPPSPAPICNIEA